MTRAPHYDSLFNYFEKPEITPLLTALVEKSASPLAAIEKSFAVDATGFGTAVYRRWYDHKYLHARFGTWRLVAKALHAKYWTLRGVVDESDNASASLAFSVARLGGASIDALFAGTWPDPDTCPHCGQWKPQSGPVAAR